MGYKLSGFDVLGCNEIDPKMMEAYRANHNPILSYLEPIQTFKTRNDIDSRLYNLDILDGSPPCSSFSMAGNREKDWGKEKKFREGQAEQVLDNLFFDFIELGKKLQPKAIVAENVKGLLIGSARDYLGRILDAFYDAGYFVRYDLLDASKMGVPQRRERVFFSAIRQDLYKGKFEDLFQRVPELDMFFDEPEIVFGEVDTHEAYKDMPVSVFKYWSMMGGASGSLSQVHEKGSFFGEAKVGLNDVAPTLTAQGKLYHPTYPRRLNAKEFCLVGSYPTDYDFCSNRPHYLIGMSVPPLVSAKVADRVATQWLHI